MVRAPRAMLLALACVAMAGVAARAQDNESIRRPPMVAPGTNAVIEPGERSGWSTPEEMRSNVEANALPAGVRQQWLEEARRLQRLGTSPALRASRSGGVLMLALSGGRTLKLFDQGVYGSALFDGDRFHVLVDLPPAANLYAVHVSMNEFDFYWLIAPSTGVMTSLPAQPVLSADLKRAFGFRDEQLNGRELGVVSIGPDGVAQEKVVWQPDDNPDIQYTLSWSADGQAIAVQETRQQTRRTSYRLLSRDGAWRRE
ncbi:MAG: hypothetical protein AB7O88_05755 [Reyranellaceae bacterium]